VELEFAGLRVDTEAQVTAEIESVSPERLASYTVAVEEGIQYHSGQVRFEGGPNRVRRDLLKE
jgi:hypothetical protein